MLRMSKSTSRWLWSIAQSLCPTGPRIAFSVRDVSLVVMGRGTSLEVAKSIDDSQLVQRLAKVTAMCAFTPPGWNGLIIRVAL